MTLQNTAYCCIAASLLSVGLTKYYFPSIQVKTVETERLVVRNDVQTVTHTVTLPSGAVDTTTTTTDHTQKIETDNKTSIVLKSSKLNISALIANDFSRGLLVPTYGVSIQKEFIGPLTLGAFGLTNGVVGLSVGLNF